MSYRLLPVRENQTLPTTVSTHSSPQSGIPSSRRLRVLAFFGTAAAAGIFFHLILLSFGSGSPLRTDSRGLVEVANDWWKNAAYGTPSLEASESVAKLEACAKNDAVNLTTAYTRPGLGQYVEPEEDEWTLERIKSMVATTKGYYVRDYSLGLGWNNMRYIVEASLLHAEILNRTLVLPSFVYARACEWNITVCAQYADMVNRGDAIGWEEWRELPIEQQMGWRVPIEVMLDLRHLRKRMSVVTLREYLLIHGIDPGREWSNGAWQREHYHSGTVSASLAVIENHLYDPQGVVRVDKMPPPAEDAMPGGQIYKALMDRFGDKFTMKLDDAEKTLRETGLFTRRDEEGGTAGLEHLLERNGFVVLHTFAGALGMDYLKSVHNPLKEIASRTSLKGLVDDYANVSEDVLLLAGETHLYRKPAALRFTSVAARDNFADLVLHWTIHISPIEVLADRIAERMSKVNDGRMWMAGHMRRGDFVRLGWSMENTLENHFTRIKQRLNRGAQMLDEIRRARGPPMVSDVPFVSPDESFINSPPPRAGDKFYLATDERSQDGLAYCRKNGAIFISDLLLPEDRRLVGWPLLFTDVLALLEQSIMAHSAYFYAHAMSSVAGGVVNQRAARGMDPRTTLID